MLRPLVSVLRKNGVPFHNPYRRSNGFWNPIRVGRPGSTANRIAALLVAHPAWGKDARPCTHGDLAQWADCLQSKGVLQHGAKKKLATYASEQQVTSEAFDDLFEPSAVESLLEAYEGDYRGLLQGWRDHITADIHARLHGDRPAVAVSTLLRTPQLDRERVEVSHSEVLASPGCTACQSFRGRILLLVLL